MYRLIACDMDETLLNDNAHVPAENIRAIKEAEKLGVKFVPATGRGFRDIEPTLRELDLLDKADQYVISYNGGCITENKDSRILEFNGLSFEKASQLYKLGLNYDVCMHVYTKDMLYMYNPDEDEVNYSTGRHEFKIIDNQDLDFLKGQDIAKLLYANVNTDYLHQVAEKIERYTEDLDVSYSSNRYLEFNAAGVNKGAGLKNLAQKLHIDLKDTIAIGDNFNDLPMIKVAGLGIGVANTNPNMKKFCDAIMTKNNNEGGVAEAINKYILKK